MLSDEDKQWIAARIDRVYDYIGDFRREAISRLDLIENRLSYQGSTVAALGEQIAPMTKAITDMQDVLAHVLSGRMESDVSRRLALLEEAVAELKKPAA